MFYASLACLTYFLRVITPTWREIKKSISIHLSAERRYVDSMLTSTTFLVWQRKHFSWMTRLRKLSGSRKSVLGKKKADLVVAGRNQSYRADTSFVRTRSRWVVVIAVFYTGWPTVVAGKYFQGSSDEVVANFYAEIWYNDAPCSDRYFEVVAFIEIAPKKYYYYT